VVVQKVKGEENQLGGSNWRVREEGNCAAVKKKEWGLWGR
jgi:hypothetical protein